MSAIIGVTAGTTTSPQKIEKEIKPVKTVNGVEPDENGNVEVKGVPPITSEDKDKVLTANEDGTAEWKESKGGEVIEVASLDDLPEDAEDGTIAVIPFGELPSEEVEESELPEVTDKDDGKVLGVEDGEWKAVALPEAENPLPEVTADDAGKVLTANEDGTAEWKEPNSGLPPVTEADNGKFLRVVDGAIALVALQEVSKEGA